MVLPRVISDERPVLHRRGEGACDRYCRESTVDPILAVLCRLTQQRVQSPWARCRPRRLRGRHILDWAMDGVQCLGVAAIMVGVVLAQADLSIYRATTT